MADDSIIKIGTSVDISGIQDGMKEAQAAVEASSTAMSASFENLSDMSTAASEAQTTAIAGIQAAMAEAQATVAASTSQMGSDFTQAIGPVTRLQAALQQQEAELRRMAAATVEYTVVQANMRTALADVASGKTPYSQASAALAPDYYCRPMPRMS